MRHPLRSAEPFGSAPANPVNGAIAPEAEVLERGEFGDRLIEFAPVEDFFGILDRIGHISLPPHTHRKDESADRDHRFFSYTNCMFLE